MSEGYTERVANELADMALADERVSGDDKIADRIGELLGASSQSLQEAYLTAVRVRRAERRARAMLAEREEERLKGVADLQEAEDAAEAAPEEAPEVEALPEPEPEPEAPAAARPRPAIQTRPMPQFARKKPLGG